MKSSLYHIQINASRAKRSIPFYKHLLTYLGFARIIDEGKDYIGIGGGNTDFWIIETDSKYGRNNYHRKNTGLNHLAFRVESKRDVDRFHQEFLKKQKIKVFYKTPKLFPEYHAGYYAVFFEDPDRIKLEVVYVPH